MPRVLTPILIDLPVDLGSYRLRQQAEFATVAGTVEGAAGTVTLQDRKTTRPGRAPWADRFGDAHSSRALLTSGSSGYPTTATPAGPVRWVRTPMISPAAVRAWTAVELRYREAGPDPGAPVATVRFTLWDGSSPLWWDGAAWAVSDRTSAEQNTSDEVEANFPALAVTVRDLAIEAYLETTDAAWTPAFFGARVLFGVFFRGALDDAVVRTFKQALLDGREVEGVQQLLNIRGELRTTTTASTTAFPVPDAEFRDVVTAVDAVFNLTTDPDSLVELAGTLAGGTWTADVAIPGGQVVHIEYRQSPDVVWSRHREVERIERMPAILLEQSGPTTAESTDARLLVRNAGASPPVALEVHVAKRVSRVIGLRLIAEFWRDVEQLIHRLRGWHGGESKITLISPETALIVDVELVEEFESTSGTLALGIQEARGAVRIAYDVPQRDTTVVRSLVRPGGVTVTQPES